MSSTLFITGTDTDVGKTFVACALLRRLRADGLIATPFKPVASGCEMTAQGLRSADAAALREASGVELTEDELNPLRYEPAIAPHLAAAERGERIDLATLDAAHANLTKRFDRIVAEGAGGWLTPLDDDLTLGDWVAGHGWPVLLVVGLRLGCLNHALLSAEAIARRTRLVGWVANLRGAEPPALAGNLDYLTRRLGLPCWLQRGDPMAPEGAAAGLFD